MKKGIIKILSALSVCTALIPGILSGCDNRSTGAILDIKYPKAYAFDDHDAKREVREKYPVDDGMTDTLTEFSYNTGSLILKDSGENKNTNYSPLSLYFALAVAASGAKGDTEKELLDLLGAVSGKTLSEQCGNLYRNLYFDNNIGKLKIPAATKNAVVSTSRLTASLADFNNSGTAIAATRAVSFTNVMVSFDTGGIILFIV